MIGYCPLDEEPIERPSWSQEELIPQPRVARRRREITSFLGEDDTECNFLVMFFIAGVITLAIMDSLPLKK